MRDGKGGSKIRSFGKPTQKNTGKVIVVFSVDGFMGSREIDSKIGTSLAEDCLGTVGGGECPG